MNEIDVKTPTPVMALFDRPMWEFIGRREMHLQSCRACGSFQYPPGPGCPSCLSMELEWKPLSGKGKIVSWTIFHKQYLPAYPVPYNVIAVKLAEGPIIISNLEGPVPPASWIGAEVELIYVAMLDGFILPRFQLKDRPLAK